MIRTALVLVLASAALPQDARKPGAAIVIGGGGDQPAIVKRVIELSGGPDARILVLPISTSVQENPGQAMAEFFREHGAKNVGIWIPKSREEADRRGIARGAPGRARLLLRRTATRRAGWGSCAAPRPSR